MFNLGDIQVEVMRPHKIVKIGWDVIKIMYENLDKTLLLCYELFFSKLKMREDENFTFLKKKS
jgi:hypothetical protein